MGDLTEEFIYEQIFNSYMLVIEKNVTPVSLRREILSTVNSLSKDIDAENFAE